MKVVKESCINCEELENCGTINRYLLDFTKSELLKNLTTVNPDDKECPNFSFIAITGEVMKHKLEKMIKLSKEIKQELKSKLKTK